MATKSPSQHLRDEWCDHCNAETNHTVSIEIVTESRKAENAKFSREPYRVSECAVCDSIERTRLNDA